MTKYIKTYTELSHPGCLLLQFYALNHVLIIYIYAGIIAYDFKILHKFKYVGMGRQKKKKMCGEGLAKFSHPPPQDHKWNNPLAFHDGRILE